MLTSVLFGISLGVLSGLLPSLGSASIMLVFMPVFLQLDPLYAFYAYLAIVITSQYMGSVTAVYTGVPGTEASVPTSREYVTILRLKLGDSVIRQNAASSLFGNLIGLVLFIVSVPIINQLLKVYKTDIKIITMTLVFVIMVLVSKSRRIGLVSLVLGCVLINLGYDDATFETFNLGWNALDNGVSWVALLMGGLVGGALVQLKGLTLTTNPSPEMTNKRHKLEPRPVIRGGVLGFIIGFTPGLSYILSSMIAYSLEKRTSKDKTVSRSVLNSLAASESAQSSGSVSMLIPFLMFAIPITASEGVIMNIITLNVGLQDVFDEVISDIPRLFFIFVLINTLAYALAVNARHVFNIVFSIPLTVIKYGLVVSSVIAIYSAVDYNLYFDLTVFAVVLVAFYYLRLDPVPFIMGVLLWPELKNAVSIYMQF